MLTVLLPLALAAASPAADVAAEARRFMDGYARDLAAGDRAAVAGRYSRQGVVFVNEKGRETVSFADNRRRYLTAWTPPAAFAWRDLEVRAVARDAAEATGGFDWTRAPAAAPLRFAYRAELRREAGGLKIALEDERPLGAPAAAAAAAPLPKEVQLVAGAFRTRPGGEPLYTYRNDTMFGMSHCEGACAVAWPPLLASAQPQPSEDWTLITRQNGSKQWAYKDKPLYRANIPVERVEAATGAGGTWALAAPR